MGIPAGRVYFAQFFPLSEHSNKREGCLRVAAGGTERAEALQAEGMYDWLGTDLHKKKYADFFDQYVFGNCC